MELLARHIELLSNSDEDVRTAALAAIAQSESGAIREAAAILHLDEDAFQPPTLPHLPMLRHKVDSKRKEAVEHLGSLSPSALLAHARMLVIMLGDGSSAVRIAAVNALARLEPAALAEYAPDLAAMIGDHHGGVRKTIVLALSKLQPSALAIYAPTLAARLDDEQGVCETAGKVLGKLDPMELNALGEDVVRKVHVITGTQQHQYI